MSELKPCDFLDNEIFVGDEVAFFALGYRMFTRGTVVKITNKCLFIDYDNSWNYDHHEEHTRQEQRQVIDLTALNRHAQPDNEPLTLDELREMDGQPVWVKYRAQVKFGEPWGVVEEWMIVGAKVQFLRGMNRSVPFEKLSPSEAIAYRYKPKEAQDER